MNNLNEYNDFIRRHNKLNEEMTSSSKSSLAPGPGSYNSGMGDTFFANVPGNLAGAEYTLVGSGIIRLFGFIKRKGMEAYMKAVLKPRLGKLLMNGVLRYAIKNNLRGPGKKEWFGIAKIQENEEVPFENLVSFTKDEQTGLSCLVVGATVNLQNPEPKIENGQYVCKQNETLFEVKDNIIISVGDKKPVEDHKEEQEGQEGQKENVEIQDISEEELQIKRDEYEKKLIEGGEEFEADPTIKQDVDFLNNILSEIKKDSDSKNDLSDTNKAFLNNWLKSLTKDINLLKNDGLNIIDDKLEKYKNKGKDTISLQQERQQYLADIKALVEIKEKVETFLSKYNKEKETTIKTESIITSYNTYLYEKQAVVTVKDVHVATNKPTVNRLGDELKELSDRGEAIDLNDEKFYKQFESDEVKKAVTKEVLTDKASLIKLQLTAENIIAGGVTIYGSGGTSTDKNRWKLDNYWKKCVQDVLGRYSKFMITESVNPYKINETIPENELNNYKNENKRIGSDGKKLDDVTLLSKMGTNKLFKDSTVLINDLSKVDKNDYCILDLSFKQEKGDQTNYYLLRKVTGKESLKIFRILGQIDLSKINSEFKEKDFTSVVKKNTFNSFLLPKNIDANGVDRTSLHKLRGVYIISDTQRTFSTGLAANKVSIMYLFSKDENVNWTDNTTYSFRFKHLNPKDTADKVLNDSFNNILKENKEFYKVTMFIDDIIKYKITSIDAFGTFDNYDIMRVKNLFELYSNNLGQK